MKIFEAGGGIGFASCNHLEETLNITLHRDGTAMVNTCGNEEGTGGTIEAFCEFNSIDDLETFLKCALAFVHRKRKEIEK